MSSRCIDCKWAFFDDQERLTIRLIGKQDILWECLHDNKAHCINYPNNILLEPLDCPSYEPCPNN